MEINDVRNWTTSLNGKVWTPTRKGNLLSRAFYELEQRVQQIQRRGPRVVDKTSGVAVVTQAGLPKQVVSCSATESPSAQVDRVFSQVSVSFTRDPGDKNFAGVHIWFTGYKGNSQPVLMTDAQDSPAVFLCETTQENVTVTVQPFNASHVAAPFAGAKTCAVALDGQTSAPPAPSIASQTATITSGAVTVGQQFAFNYLPSSVSDVIDGYWIYRTNVHSTPGITSRWKFVKASVQNSGIYTLVDSSGVSTNFYYVSSVNKQGLESSLTDATGGSSITTLRPSTHSVVQGGGYSSPSNVWDGNSSTYSVANITSIATDQDTWQGWSTLTGTAKTLKVTSYAVVSSAGNTRVKLEYSTDNGSTWTVIYNVTSNRSLRTDSITLAAAQDLTQLKIRGTASNGDGSAYRAQHDIAEAWVEVSS